MTWEGEVEIRAKKSEREVHLSSLLPYHSCPIFSLPPCSAKKEGGIPVFHPGWFTSINFALSHPFFIHSRQQAGVDVRPEMIYTCFKYVLF